MNFIKLFNPLKRKILKSFTSVFRNKTDEIVHNNDDIKRILICRSNHRLGNLLLLSPLVQELESTFPYSKIDLLVNQSCVRQLYLNYSSIDRILEFPQKPFKNLITYIRVFLRLKSRHYDLAINAVESSSSGRIFTVFSSAKYKFVKNDTSAKETLNQETKHVAKQSVLSLRYFLKTCDIQTLNDTPYNLDLKLTNSELMNGGNLVYNIVQNTFATMCLFTNATGAKCYSEKWWLKLYSRLQISFPDVNIIEVLPKEKISKIEFKAPTFYSTDIRELGSFIANTDIFIGADSGVMHLASASYTPTIGLFSITDIEKYKPYNEGSISIKTEGQEVDQIINYVTSMLYPNLNTSS